MNRIPICAGAVVLAAGLAGVASAAPGQHSHELPVERGAREVAGPQLRLAVADGSAGRVSIVNLASRRVIARFGLAAPASLHGAGDGRHVLATQSAADRVDVIDGGSWSVAHGDHAHHYARAARVRARITGATPIHTVAHDGRVAIFNDGTGVALLQASARIGNGPRGARRVRTPAPHHGVAVPVGTRTLVSLPSASGSPDGVGVAGPDGRISSEFRGCPGLHGEATVGNTVLFAYADGYLAVTATGARFSARKTGAVAGAEGPRRSGTLASAHGLPYAIGNLGNSALVRINPRTGPVNVIDTGVERGHFVLDPDSRSVLTVAVDGRLLQINPTTGRTIRAVRVTAPFSLAGGFSVPRPQIALGHERRVYVSDPDRGRVVELATNPLRVTRAFAVGGAPTSLVVLGDDHGEDAHDH